MQLWKAAALEGTRYKNVGGGGGNRTRVHKHSAFGSTCLAASINLTPALPDGQDDARASPLGF